MKLHGIEQLTKKDIPLYYRNEYEGLGDLEFVLGDRRRVPLEFSVEIKPTGERVVNVRIRDRIDYPLLPVIRAIKAEVLIMEKDGKLR
ncbi:MAG: hypothetical protein RQ801_09470 [Spirochaetaceae bacterium]|nr:hypothetical protein [Spirochaetaceae bacterium]MDT8298516.1 hypothetical protein [Spirochaetaceae bacterium]